MLYEVITHGRVVRAMSSPAGALGLAFSPFVAGAGCRDADRAAARALLSPAGLCDEVADEDQIDLFTALTGPVPGFVAGFAEALVAYSVERGVAPGVADRAVQQLILASGTVLATTPPTRITSYNVCYTKLLREVMGRPVMAR